MADSVLPNPQTMKKLLDYFSSSYLSVLFDPLSMVDDEMKNNTLSYFGEFLALLSEDIAAIRLRDSVGHIAVPLGQGIMAKSLPRIASLMTKSVPVIRSGGEGFLRSDIAYIKKIFSN